MGRYVLDPDGDVTSKYIPEKSPLAIPEPVPNQWTHDLTGIPNAFTYACIMNYLVYRKIKVYKGSDDEENPD